MPLIISCSLNPNSKSRRMARYAQQFTKEPSAFIDLQDQDLPLYDGSPKPAFVEQWIEQISAASSILLAAPVYNYDLNAAAKNLIEWTGRGWTQKTVGFLLAAGGKNSFMTPLSFMNSLMLDYRCIIIPRYVYADRSLFDEEGIHPSVQTRIQELVTYTTEVGEALRRVHS